jgi:hypothetical protein
LKSLRTAHTASTGAPITVLRRISTLVNG